MKKKLFAILMMLSLAVSFMPNMAFADTDLLTDNQAPSVSAETQSTNQASLLLQAKAVGKHDVKLTWNKTSGATKYVVYGAKCGKNIKKLATVKGTKYTVKKISKKSLKAHKTYKFYVRAYSGNTKLAQSRTLHFITANTMKKYANVTKVTAKKSISLEVGKTANVNAKYSVYKNKKHITTAHGAAFKYMSSNTTVATVNASGKVTAKAEGTAYIYAQDVSGKYAKTKVSVKLSAEEQAFETYKQELLAQCDGLLQDSDSDEVKRLIEDAKREILNASYDSSNDLNASRAMLQSIFSKFSTLVREQRAKDGVVPMPKQKGDKISDEILEGMDDIDTLSSFNIESDDIPIDSWETEDGSRLLLVGSGKNLSFVLISKDGAVTDTISCSGGLTKQESDYAYIDSKSGAQIQFTMTNDKVTNIVFTGYTDEKSALNGTYKSSYEILWSGELSFGSWANGLRDLSWGGYDWSQVKAGSKLKAYFETDLEANLRELRFGNGNWDALPGTNEFPNTSTDGNITINEGATHYDIILTQAMIDSMLNVGGLVLCGAGLTLKCVKLAKPIPPKEFDLKDYFTSVNGDPISFSYPFNIKWDDSGRIGIQREGMQGLNLVAGKSKLVFYKETTSTGEIQINDCNWTAVANLSDWVGTEDKLEFIFTADTLASLVNSTPGWSGQPGIIVQGSGLVITKIAVKP